MSRTFHHFHTEEPRNERRAAHKARRAIDRDQEREQYEQRELTELHREGATGALRRAFA